MGGEGAESAERLSSEVAAGGAVLSPAIVLLLEA